MNRQIALTERGVEKKLQPSYTGFCTKSKNDEMMTKNAAFRPRQHLPGPKESSMSFRSADRMRISVFDGFLMAKIVVIGVCRIDDFGPMDL